MVESELLWKRINTSSQDPEEVHRCQLFELQNVILDSRWSGVKDVYVQLAFVSAGMVKTVAKHWEITLEQAGIRSAVLADADDRLKITEIDVPKANSDEGVDLDLLLSLQPQALWLEPQMISEEEAMLHGQMSIINDPDVVTGVVEQEIKLFKTEKGAVVDSKHEQQQDLIRQQESELKELQQQVVYGDDTKSTQRQTEEFRRRHAAQLDALMSHQKRLLRCTDYALHVFSELQKRDSVKRVRVCNLCERILAVWGEPSSSVPLFSPGKSFGSSEEGSGGDSSDDWNSDREEADVGGLPASIERTRAPYAATFGSTGSKKSETAPESPSPPMPTQEHNCTGDSPERFVPDWGYKPPPRGAYSHSTKSASGREDVFARESRSSEDIIREGRERREAAAARRREAAAARRAEQEAQDSRGDWGSYVPRDRGWVTKEVWQALSKVIRRGNTGPQETGDAEAFFESQRRDREDSRAAKKAQQDRANRLFNEIRQKKEAEEIRRKTNEEWKEKVRAREALHREEMRRKRQEEAAREEYYREKEEEQKRRASEETKEREASAAYTGAYEKMFGEGAAKSRFNSTATNPKPQTNNEDHATRGPAPAQRGDDATSSRWGHSAQANSSGRFQSNFGSGQSYTSGPNDSRGAYSSRPSQSTNQQSRSRPIPMRSQYATTHKPAYPSATGERLVEIKKLNAAMPWVSQSILDTRSLQELRQCYVVSREWDETNPEARKEMAYVRSTVEPRAHVPPHAKTDMELMDEVRFYGRYAAELKVRFKRRSMLERLGCPSSSKSSDVKKSFRRLALTWHPDNIYKVHRGYCFADEKTYIDTVTEVFRYIEEAYRTIQESKSVGGGSRPYR